MQCIQKAIFTPGHWVVPSSESRTRTTPSRPGRPAGQHSPKTIRNSRKSILEGRDSSECPDVSYHSFEQRTYYDTPLSFVWGQGMSFVDPDALRLRSSALD